MAQFPETRISLIIRLAAANDVDAWREFAELYAPAVFSLARMRGLQTADAEDFVQELLLAVARAATRWQPDGERARFRTWLYAVSKNLLADHFSKRLAQQFVANDVDVHDTSNANCLASQSVDLEQQFDLEYRRATFQRAAKVVRERVQATTWQAFEATAVHDEPAESVARRVGLSVGSVYVARSRVLKLIRQEVELLERELNDNRWIGPAPHSVPCSGEAQS